MKVKYFVLFLFSALLSNAQVSGYMGKRFSIGYSNYFMLSAIGPTANAENADFGTIGVNSTHCLDLEYIVKSRTNFCLSLQTSKTGVDPGEISYYSYDPINYNSYYYTYKYDVKPYKPMQVRSINLGLGFKFFQSGSLSPIGKYKKVELLLMFNHLTYKKNGFSYYDSGYNRIATFGSGDYQYSTFAITYAIGRSRVLFDKIVLDGGIRFGVMPAGFWAYLNQDGDFFDTSSSSGTFYAETQFKYDVNMRLFRCQLFNFHVGLSFLAF